MSGLCSLYGVQLEGENALSRVDQEAYRTIAKHCKGGYGVEIVREDEDGSLTGGVTKAFVPAMKSFTYLRLHDELITDEENFERFKEFFYSVGSFSRALSFVTMIIAKNL